LPQRSRAEAGAQALAVDFILLGKLLCFFSRRIRIHKIFLCLQRIITTKSFLILFSLFFFEVNYAIRLVLLVARGDTVDGSYTAAHAIAASTEVDTAPVITQLFLPLVANGAGEEQNTPPITDVPAPQPDPTAPPTDQLEPVTTPAPPAGHEASDDTLAEAARQRNEPPLPQPRRGSLPMYPAGLMRASGTNIRSSSRR